MCVYKYIIVWMYVQRWDRNKEYNLALRSIIIYPYATSHTQSMSVVLDKKNENLLLL